VKGLMGVTALKVSLGHYANRGFADARGSGSGAGRRLILQVRDRRAFLNSSDEYLRAVADHYCPCPVKYRQVWSQLRGRPLYLWRPVPPNEAFVCLGMVATTSPETPPLDALRCVPKSFCRPCTRRRRCSSGTTAAAAASRRPFGWSTHRRFFGRRWATTPPARSSGRTGGGVH
ncbi:unnamed protein product, partial [Effrenium voratum]